VKNQLGNVMNLRALIGISAAFLALACSGSDDKDPGSDNPTPNPTVNNPDPNPTSTSTGTVPTPVATDPIDVEQPLDEAYVESMLRTTCGGCHGAAAAGNCRAGMCYIESIDELIENSKIIPGDPNASLLYQRISRGEMPPAGNTPLNDDQIQQIATFILKLKAPPVTRCDDQFITWDQVYTAIQNDLVSADADDRVFFRYVSISNRYNAGVCDAQLEQDRWAMNKFINSISQNAGIEEAEEIPDAENSKSIYRIDLREYDLDEANGPFEVNGIQFVDGWDAIINNNNYAVEFEGDEAEFAILETGTNVPFMFSDAIIDEASNGNLYYGLLKLADNRDDQLALFQIDLVANQDEASSVFIGTTKSEISEQEAFVRRDEIEIAGSQYYYERFDLDPDVAGESILADPLGFFDVANGSQALFSLPNGLQAYMIFDADGLRQETSEILFDQFQNNNTMTASVSCNTCHAGGLLQVADEVRDYAEVNSIDITNGINDLNALNGTDFEFSDVTDLYRDNAEIKEIITGDSQVYRSALQRAGVPLNGSDPISDTFIRFDRDVTINDVAGDILFRVEELEQNIARLDPALAGLDNDVTVDRDDWKGLFVNTLCITSVSQDNHPLDQECIDAGAL